MIRLWNRFWFAPRPPGALGLFRIVFGLLVVAYALLLWPDRALWFSDAGVVTRVQAYAFYGPTQYLPRLDVLAWTGDRGLTLFFCVLIASALLLTVGLWTRFAAFVVWACVLTLHNRTIPIHNSGDTVMQVMAAYLILSPCGAACSLDRLGRILRGTEGDVPSLISGWTQRLMQLQVATVYACTSLSKWQGSMWRDGTAVWYPMHLPDSRRFSLPLVEAFPHLTIPALTYGTLAIETALWTLVWFPRLRFWVLGAGVLLHLGIEYALNIPLFSALMIASYIVFLRQSDLERFAAWLRPASPLRVVYDGECDFCKSSLLIVHFLDALKLITFVDYHDPAQLSTVPGVAFADAEKSAIAVDVQDRQHAGFYAFRQIAWRLPVTWLLAPLMYVPGVPFVGVHVYGWVVRNRSRLPVAPRFKGANAGAPLPFAP